MSTLSALSGSATATTPTPTALEQAIARLMAPNAYGESLPATHWDVCGPSMMTTDDLTHTSYDYTRQAYAMADHVHIAPALPDGAPLFCGADAVSCLGAEAARSL